MDMSEIPPVKSIEDYYPQNAANSGTKKNVQKAVDSKVQSLVLSQIKNGLVCSLFASVTCPFVLEHLLSGMNLPSQPLKWGRKEKGRKRVTKQESQVPPIGVVRCKEYPPLGSILQLLLFIPIFRDVFSFSPQSFKHLNDFVALYLKEQSAGLKVSTGSTSRVLELLKACMPAVFFNCESARVSIKDFLCSLIKSVYERGGESISSSLAFHLDWNIFWDTSFPFSSVIDLPIRPYEILVTVRPGRELTGAVIQRQFFTKSDGYCYDLEGFVEFRHDGVDSGSYITYVKAEGGWYQCDDERITVMRSDYLKSPLTRCVLLYYKLIWPKRAIK